MVRSKRSVWESGMLREQGVVRQQRPHHGLALLQLPSVVAGMDHRKNIQLSHQKNLTFFVCKISAPTSVLQATAFWIG